MVALFVHIVSGDRAPTGPSRHWFQLVPTLVPLAAGIAAGTAVWLMLKDQRRGRELEEANRALARMNERLKLKATVALQSEQRFRLLFSSNPCPMWIFDCQTLAITDVNEAALRQYGYTREEFLSLTTLDLRPPEEFERFKAHLLDSNEGYGYRGIWIHRRKDGTRLRVEIRAFRFASEDRIRELVLAQDVTARVAAEEALKVSEAALKSMVDNAPFGICCTSLRRDCFEDFNPALREMLGGYTRDEMLALKISTQVYQDPRDRDRMVELLRRGRRLNAFEATFLRKDGETIRIRAWGVLRGNPEDEPDLLDVYIENITEHSTLEQQIRQVQKLEAVGRLAGGIAHDFNNILVVIRLSTELMLGKVTLDSPLSKPLLQVLSAADRATGLTRQLLAFARQQLMQTRTVNLNAVVADTLQLLRRTIGEDIELVTRLDEHLQNTRLDPDQLAQVIMNLAINSRDAMPLGGTLHIETRNVELDAPYARSHEPVQPGRYVMLAVTDSGTGIDRAILPRIFDPFFTTKEIGKGTGLGLSIVYGIVKQSGGYVWVYSEPGQGTTFRLYFPITDCAAEMSVERFDVQPASGDKHVLVVEDEAEIRQNLCECLKQLGYQVQTAADGAEALSVFQDSEEKIDLVLTDLVMPRMGGQDLWTRLMQRDPGVAFVFMSGYTEDAALQRGILNERSRFLTKPFSVAELAATVQRTLALQEIGNREELATV
jgi:PAS domain S-box-containing protein